MNDLVQNTTATQSLLSIVAGVLAPVVISWLKSRHWSDAQKYACALGVSVVLAALVAWIDGRLTWGDWARDLGLVFTTATGVYQTYFKQTMLNAKLEILGPFTAKRYDVRDTTRRPPRV